MKNNFPLLAFLGLLIVNSSQSRAQPKVGPKPRLTVSAAVSMKDALNQINARFNVAAVRVNYGASGALQRQIENGAPVDVFIAASTKNMNALAKNGSIDAATRRNLVANQLVLIVPANESRIKSFTDLNRPTVRRFAMGAPQSVPAGQYAQQVLTHLKLHGSVASKAVLAKDVRQVLTQVALGNVDAGIVYKTDALTSKNVKIVANAPANSHSPILYPVAVVKDSKQPAAARAYVRFLQSATARNIFKRYGFLVVGK